MCHLVTLYSMNSYHVDINFVGRSQWNFLFPATDGCVLSSSLFGHLLSNKISYVFNIDI